jgi:hypothetical protein
MNDSTEYSATDSYLGTEGTTHAQEVRRPYPTPDFGVSTSMDAWQARLSREGEYILGAQWLPRIGASLVTLGIGSVIRLAYVEGNITPSVIFGTAVAMCLGFILAGILLRNEREDFGRVLMGVGSCGMYVTIAGGFYYQKLYAENPMLFAFTVWSMINLGYVYLRPSKAFLAIGLLGGFAATSMPIPTQDYATSLAIHAFIVLLGSIVIVRHRMSMAAVGMWLASGIALVPIALARSLAWETKVGSIYVFALVALLAYLLGRKAKRPLEDAVVAGSIAIAASLASFVVQRGLPGTQHALVAAAGCAVLAIVFRREAQLRTVMGYAAVGIATILAPLGLEMDGAPTFAALSVGSSLASALAKRPNIATLGVCHLLAAGGCYLYRMATTGTAMQNEIGLLSMTLAGCVALAVAVGRLQSDPRLLVAFVGAWAAVSRLGYILIAPPNEVQTASFGITLAWMGFGSGILAAGFASNLCNYRFAGLTVLLAAAAKSLAADIVTASPHHRSFALLGTGALLLVGGFIYVRCQAGSSQPGEDGVAARFERDTLQM